MIYLKAFRDCVSICIHIWMKNNFGKERHITMTTRCPAYPLACHDGGTFVSCHSNGRSQCRSEKRRLFNSGQLDECKFSLCSNVAICNVWTESQSSDRKQKAKKMVWRKRWKEMKHNPPLQCVLLKVMCFMEDTNGLTHWSKRCCVFDLDCDGAVHLPGMQLL